MCKRHQEKTQACKLSADQRQEIYFGQAVFGISNPIFYIVRAEVYERKVLFADLGYINVVVHEAGMCINIKMSWTINCCNVSRMLMTHLFESSKNFEKGLLGHACDTLVYRSHQWL